jgi:hypothetical protein
MNEKRIEEVAKKIGELKHPYVENTAAYLRTLPEFNAPVSPWVQCSERLPKDGKTVVLAHKKSYTITLSFDRQLGTTAIAWMEIPPYVASESELVRRFRARVNDKSLEGINVIEALKQVEKELADGK